MIASDIKDSFLFFIFALNGFKFQHKTERALFLQKHCAQKCAHFLPQFHKNAHCYELFSKCKLSCMLFSLYTTCVNILPKLCIFILCLNCFMKLEVMQIFKINCLISHVTFKAWDLNICIKMWFRRCSPPIQNEIIDLDESVGLLSGFIVHCTLLGWFQFIWWSWKSNQIKSQFWYANGTL